MITATASKVVLEDNNHRFFNVWAEDRAVTHRRKTFKTFNNAIRYANELMSYYQVPNLTEQRR